MSTPAPVAPPATLQSVGEDALVTFLKFVAPVAGLALVNHLQGQVVSISAVYQAAYAGVAAAAAILIHGVPAVASKSQKAKAAQAQADLAKLVAAVRAAEAADAAKPVTPAV